MVLILRDMWSISLHPQARDKQKTVNISTSI